MRKCKIVKGSNFDKEVFTEEFVTGIPSGLSQHQANIICSAINAVCQMQAGSNHDNHYKVVDEDYVLYKWEP